MSSAPDFRLMDAQMADCSGCLRDDIGVTADVSRHLGTKIYQEVLDLGDGAKEAVKAASPVPVSARIQEIVCLQTLMEGVGPDHPVVIRRAQVLCCVYVCFVYLQEALFKVLLKNSDAQSATRLCCKFLTDNPVRAFRNAIAHGNWQYSEDPPGIVYWARKGADENEPLSRFEVNQEDLNFWNRLARCVAQSAILAITQGPQ